MSDEPTLTLPGNAKAPPERGPHPPAKASRGMTQTIHGLEPVSTVFGPFLRDPVDAVSSRFREAVETGSWCEGHGRIEFGPHYLICLECGHGFSTPEALLADHAALVEDLNRCAKTDPFAINSPGMLEPKTDPKEITTCPHCAHDL